MTRPCSTMEPRKDQVMLKLSAIALGAALIATSAHAGPTLSIGQEITVSDAKVIGSTVTLSGPVSVTTTAGPVFLQTSIGNLLVWCIDLYHDIVLKGGQNLHYVAGTVTSNYAPTASTLTPLQSQEIQGLAAYGTDLYNTGNATPDELAAVQLAIWTVENPALTYTGANAAITDADLALAPSLHAPSGALVALDGTQSFVAVAVDVPEPVSMAIFASALTGLGLLRRRKA